MNKIATFLICMAMTSVVGFAQRGALPVDTATVKITDVTRSDSTAANQTIADYADLDSDQPTENPYIYVRDGQWGLFYGGKGYVISDLIENAALMDNLGRFDDVDESSHNNNFSGDISRVIIVALVFGIPCLTIVSGLMVILTYALRRNRERYNIINHAIDCNYTLPDSFYLGHKNINDVPDTPSRDPKKFYSAITLLSIGLSLVIFAIASDTSFFLLAGGIPLFIGTGRMIGFYCVPVAQRNNMQFPYGAQSGGMAGQEQQRQNSEPYISVEVINTSKTQKTNPDESVGCSSQTPPPYNPS